MKTAEYTIREIRSLMDGMSGMYDIVRVVDPTECRVLDFMDDDSFTMNERCYGVWHGEQRCMNCCSADACRTGCPREKKEDFQGQLFHIHSNPVKLKLKDGGIFDAIVEMVNIIEKPETSDAGDDECSKDHNAAHMANDRESEDKDRKGLIYQATSDSLTGVLKADAFFEQARDLIINNKDVCWTMVTGDIKEFRLVNSLFGVEKGNEVLIWVAGHLRKIAEDSKGICGRLQGDKFALLIPQASYRESEFEKTADELSEIFSNGVFTLCIHFGVYKITDPKIPVSVMCDRANMAVRTIHKNHMIKIAHFNEEIMQKSLAEQEIISGFEEALKEGQFHMYLQPLKDDKGVTFGAEALVRWIRPDGTNVLPQDFIGTLEYAGLIHELDKNIMEQAAKQLSKWKNTEKKDLSISVNISAKDFYYMDVYQVATDIVRKYDIDSSRLRLEITETAVIENPETSQPVIAKLQEDGFIIEIDDFGKGHSSLSLLKDIRADILKIDMGFVRETENIKRSQIILRSVIAMADALGMQVITEGIETEMQLDSLVSMGCRYFQGYYFSRPVPVREFEKKQ